MKLHGDTDDSASDAMGFEGRRPVSTTKLQNEPKPWT
jgi:hypothetical protein